MNTTLIYRNKRIQLPIIKPGHFAPLICRANNELFKAKQTTIKLHCCLILVFKPLSMFNTRARTPRFFWVVDVLLFVVCVWLFVFMPRLHRFSLIVKHSVFFKAHRVTGSYWNAAFVWIYICSVSSAVAIRRRFKGEAFCLFYSKRTRYNGGYYTRRVPL